MLTSFQFQRQNLKPLDMNKTAVDGVFASFIFPLISKVEGGNKWSFWQ